MRNQTLMIVAIGALLFFAMKSGGSGGNAQKRTYLNNLSNSSKFNQLTDSEIDDVYLYATQYMNGGTMPADLEQRLNQINARYGIFNS